MSKIVSLLEQVALFQKLSSNRLEELSQHFTVVKESKGQMLYFAGSQPECINFLICGQVKATSYLADGKKLINLIYQPGSFFAESSLEDKPLPFCLETKDYCIMLRVSTKNFWGILEKNPDLNRRFIQLLANKNLEQSEQLTLLGTPDAAERISKYLTFLYKLNPMRVPISLTHLEISEACMVTRETATRAISRLTKTGQIIIEGRKIIPCFN